MLRTGFGVLRNVLAIVGIAAITLCLLEVRVVSWSEGEALYERAVRQRETFESTMSLDDTFAAQVWQMHRVRSTFGQPRPPIVVVIGAP
jgi:hypothetical protein